MKEEVLRRVYASGAVAAGIAAAGRVEEEAISAFRRWLASGRHAGMAYMANHREVREDSRLLLDKGAASVISMAFAYPPGECRDKRLPAISGYALVADYHQWIRRRLRESGAGELLGREGEEWRICVDSAPVMERYWARRAGIGVIGCNGALVVPGVGSRVFLAEIATTVDLTADEPAEGDCGKCGKCTAACPTGALGKDGMIDCDRCISYLTIEHRGEWNDPRHLAAMATEGGRDTLFGCDRCIEACPHNRRATQCVEEILQGAVTITPADIIAGDAKSLTARLKNSSLKRAGQAGLLRNARNAGKF